MGIGRLVLLSGKEMGSKRRSFSNSSSIADPNIDNKLKGVIDNNNPISDVPLLKVSAFYVFSLSLLVMLSIWIKRKW